MLRLRCTLLVLLLVGCDSAPIDAPDAMTENDAGLSTPDAALDADLGRDGGPTDAGGSGDAGEADAGHADAGTDAGPVCSCSVGELCAEELCVPDVSAGSMQRANLPEDPTSPRFTVPMDRVWPASPDAPHIALWRDDALATITITIDDNCAPDHDWWVTTAAAHGIPLTWFVITDRVGTSAFFGSWDGFNVLADAGHSVQSHGAPPGQPPRSSDPGAMAYYEDTYTRSVAALEANVAAPVDVIGHPWGRYYRELVAMHFIGGRGTTGQINRPAQIDYLDTASRSQGLDRAAIDEILGSGRNGRGWYSVHYHLLDDAKRTAAEAELTYIDSRRADLWVGTFRDVVRYGQERDTAQIVVHHTDAERVVFSLTDEMADTPFDLPLTIKVRMPSAGSEVTATQAGVPITARRITHDGVGFGLLDVVPDRGPVVMRVVP
ncbi:MAG: polysaccharide deacetylase family protein [Sandaracinaceae bacterium]